MNSMAKGFEINQERRRALDALGKDLTRRAKSRCELTHAAGVPLSVYEIPPHPPEPDVDHCLLLSAAALRQVRDPLTLRAEEWHHLADLVWSEIPAVQVMCLRILRRLAPDEPWAQRLLEETYPDPEVETWSKAASLGD
jgi:protein PhnA